MPFNEFFDLNGVSIHTHVVKNKYKIGDVLQSFLHAADSDQQKIVGLDIELHVSQKDMGDDSVPVTKCATLHLCDGVTCLIIQLLDLESLPVSLLNFLHMPDYTFVGVGIKDDLNKLEQQCGIICRNSVELGPLAASVMKMPRLGACGIDELSCVVNKVDLRKHRPTSAFFKDWGQYNLSKKLAKLATVNAYSFYKVGSKLLASD